MLMAVFLDNWPRYSDYFVSRSKLSTDAIHVSYVDIIMKMRCFVLPIKAAISFNV